MPERQYDVALSFAGEDRDYARGVADALQGTNISLFFDEFESTELWGKDLAVEFSAIYGQRATFVVPFVSQSYAGRAWPRLEFRSALAAAIEAEGERILPVRLDDTVLPGLRSTIAYLDGRRLTPNAVAEAILKKVRNLPSAPQAAVRRAVTQPGPAGAEVLEIEGDLAMRLRSRGYWQVELLPLHVVEDRFKITRGLIFQVAEQSVNLRGWSCPNVNLNTQPQIEVDSIGQDTEWEHFHELWRLLKSGKFIHLAGMRYDWGAMVQASAMEAHLGDSPLLGIGDAVFRFTEIATFASKYSNGMLDGEPLTALIEVGGLRGRRLFVDDSGRLADGQTHVATTKRPYVARLDVGPSLQPDDLLARARACAHELYGLFGFEIDDVQLEKWQRQIRQW